MQQDIASVMQTGSIEESQRIFHLAREQEYEQSLNAQDKKTNHIYVILGTIVLCIAVVAGGYALTHRTQQKPAPMTKQPSSESFAYQATSNLALQNLRTFEKKDAWNKVLTTISAKGITKITVTPLPTLPDIFGTSTATVTSFAGIQSVAIGAMTNPAGIQSPFIVATISGIDATNDALTSHTAQLSEGLALFFGYDNLSINDRANVTTDTIIYKNQPMTRVYTRIRNDAVNTSAEVMLQSLVDSVTMTSTDINAPSEATDQQSASPSNEPNTFDNRLLFAYTIIRQKYLVIAPDETILFSLLGSINPQ